VAISKSLRVFCCDRGNNILKLDELSTIHALPANRNEVEKPINFFMGIQSPGLMFGSVLVRVDRVFGIHKDALHLSITKVKTDKEYAGFTLNIVSKK
jgi:hypothetical protein